MSRPILTHSIGSERNRARRTHRARANASRGVVLFVALVVLVVLGLASAALLRSAETATLVAGHLATRQATMAAVDRGIEQAIGALFASTPSIADRTRHDPAQNYFACIQGSTGSCLAPGSAIPEIPAVLESSEQFAAAHLNSSLVADDSAGHTSVYAIERLCLAPGAALASVCNLPAVAPPSSGGEPGGASPDAYYRVTVKVTGSRNTVAYAQASLRPPRDGVGMRRVAWRIVVTD